MGQLWAGRRAATLPIHGEPTDSEVPRPVVPWSSGRSGPEAGGPALVHQQLGTAWRRSPPARNNRVSGDARRHGGSLRWQVGTDFRFSIFDFRWMVEPLNRSDSRGRLRGSRSGVRRHRSVRRCRSGECPIGCPLRQCDRATVRGRPARVSGASSASAVPVGSAWFPSHEAVRVRRFHNRP